MRLMMFVALWLSYGIGATVGEEMLDQQRPTEVESLISFLADNKNFEENTNQVADAITKLGQLKAVEAVPILIEHIDFCDPRSRYEKFDPYTILKCRVAVEALVQIGKPSVEPLLKASTSESKRVRLVCMAAVIRAVEGREQGKALIDSVIAKSGDDEVKDRLSQLRSFVLNPPLR